MSLQTPHHGSDEERRIYWIPIWDEASAQGHRAAPSVLAYTSEVIGLKHTPCPPWCHAPAPIGRGFIMATPVFTFAMLVAVSVVFGLGAIPWVKIIVGSLLGIPAGFGLGYLYYLGSHSAIQHFEIALGRKQLLDEVNKKGL